MPSLLDYRRHLSQAGLHAFKLGTADNTSSTTALGDALNLKTTLPVNDKYEGAYLLRPNATSMIDRLAQVPPYVAGSPPTGYDCVNGLIYPDRTYIHQPAISEPYELHWHGFDPTVDLTHFINEALLAAYAVTEVTVPTTPQFFRTSLAALTWLTNPKDVYQVGWLAPSETRDIWDPFEGRALRGEVIREGNGSLYVQHTGRAFSGLETLYLRVKQPLYYGTSTGAGLGADSDTCWAPVQWITAGALVQAWFEFPLIMEQGADQRRVTQQQAAQMMWNAMSARWFVEPPHTIEPIEFLGLNLGHAGLVW